MNKKNLQQLTWTALALGLLCFVLVAGETTVRATDCEASLEDAAPAYVDAAKCRMCHSSARMADESYKKWVDGPHGKAFESLSTPEAIAAAKELGIDDPTTNDRCLKCHVTAVDKPTEGISCEHCHGPAEHYLKPHALKDDARPPHDEMYAMGMTDLSTQEAREQLCMSCHAEDPDNPFHKPFDYETYWSKIAHGKTAEAAEAEAAE